ncbi:hypothetical protein [Amycolatopsis plumensis]|uniref:Uncharacterized protein n=1 Tax=Amycolatopsis plumensis TaxID=236508 RepID=A0ABV5U5K4_9PSEU
MSIAERVNADLLTGTPMGRFAKTTEWPAYSTRTSPAGSSVQLPVVRDRTTSSAWQQCLDLTVTAQLTMSWGPKR